MIVGGESGASARPMRKEWVLSLRDQCHQAGVRFFFKQWGGVRKKQAGHRLDGKTYDEFPPRPHNPIGSAEQCDTTAREIEEPFCSGVSLPYSVVSTTTGGVRRSDRGLP